MKHLSLLIAAFALAITQCERHSWEDVTDEHGHVTEKGTKRLFEAHGTHGGEAGQHGAKDAGHGEDAGQETGEAQGQDADGKAGH